MLLLLSLSHNDKSSVSSNTTNTFLSKLRFEVKIFFAESATTSETFVHNFELIDLITQMLWRLGMVTRHEQRKILIVQLNSR